MHRIHRLVYESFVGPLGSLDVNHIDGDKRNNSLSNLEAVTDRENKRHAMKNGLVARGEQKKHILTEGDVVQILQRRLDGLSYGKIGKEFGVSSFVVRDVLTGRTWRHTTGLPRHIPAGKKNKAILEADNEDYDLHQEELGDLTEVGVY